MNMAKQKLTDEQKRLDTDLWIIILVTLGVFLFYTVTGKQLMSFVANSSISVIPRLLLNAGVQFGIAGLGITIVCIFRKENFTYFGLTRKNLFKTNEIYDEKAMASQTDSNLFIACRFGCICYDLFADSSSNYDE